MFGLEVLAWHSHPEDNKSYSSILKKYLFGNTVSHTALKITIPASLENDKLVQQYCSRLPHFKTTVAVPEKMASSSTYRPKQVPAWVIYFSRWPSKFAREYEDQISASAGLKFELGGRWSAYFENKQQKGSRGMLGYWLGKRLYDFRFGKPGKIQAPIMTVVHPHPQQEQWMASIKNAEFVLQNLQMQMLEALKVCFALTREIQLLLYKGERLQRRFDEAQYFMDERQQYAKLSQILSLAEIVNQLTHELDKIKIFLEEIEAAEEQAKQELIALENIYYSQIASIGFKPSRVVHLAVKGVNTTENGFSLEGMLQKMHNISLHIDQFMMIFNNCSHAVEDVLLAGLTTESRQVLIQAGLMQAEDFAPSLIAYPERIVEFAQKLESVWRRHDLSRLLLTASPNIVMGPQDNPKTMLVARTVNDSSEGQLMSHQPCIPDETTLTRRLA